MTQNDPRANKKAVAQQNPADDLWANLGRLFEDERRVVSVALVVILGFAFYDFFEDRAEGASADALFSDFSDVFLPLILLGYIWRFKPKSLLQKSIQLEGEVLRNREDLQLWKSRASAYIQGLSKSINQQFDDWRLSKAEKEVGLLLLKGLSLRDLSSVRGVFERTARQQATSIYNKAGLLGTAELSAFFLEDLMFVG